MNLETLQYFQFIAKYKNITKAAKHFYISQSTLSRQIMSLETELKTTLFKRSNKILELTEAGKVMSNECDMLIKHIELVTAHVQAVESGNKGSLRLATIGKLSPCVTSSIENFYISHPQTRLHLESYDFDEIPRAISYDLFHAGFTYEFAAENYEDLEILPIDSDDFCLIVSRKTFPNPTWEDLPAIIKTMPLILPIYTEPPFLKLMMHELQCLARLNTINITRVNTTDSVVLDVSLGLGYGIVPTSLTQSKSGHEHLSYIPLKDFSSKGAIVMIYKKPIASEALHTFIKIVKSNRILKEDEH